MFLNWYKSYGSSCKMSTFDKYMYIYDSKCDVYTASQYEIWLSSMSKFINVRILKKRESSLGTVPKTDFSKFVYADELKNMFIHYTWYVTTLCYK